LATRTISRTVGRICPKLLVALPDRPNRRPCYPTIALAVQKVRRLRHGPDVWVMTARPLGGNATYIVAKPPASSSPISCTRADAAL
jgi:hypothetical protein